MPDHREAWQIEQGARCGCRGSDEYCACQNRIEGRDRPAQVFMRSPSRDWHEVIEGHRYLVVQFDTPLSKPKYSVDHSLELEPMNTIERAVEGLIAKAAEAEKSEDAMRFSQASLNAANAAITLANMKRDQN